MSGTGNTFNAARWAAEAARRKRVKALLSPIERAKPHKELAGKDTLLGLLMPTHGFIAPWHMFRFACRLPRGKGRHAFCLATQAGFKAGRSFVPGISGSANYLIALVLALKGYKVHGILPLDMPSNWTAVHSAYDSKHAAAMYKRAEKTVGTFISGLLGGERRWLNGANIYQLVWGIVLFPISLLYLLIGRFYLAKLFFANEKCNSCGICEKYCPVGAVVLRGVKNPWPFWRYNCESCMRCMSYCPKQAIEASHSWAVILGYLTSLPVAAYLVSTLQALTACPEGAKQIEGFAKLVEYAYIYLVIFLSYYVFYLLVRIPATNPIFSFTTFTRLYSRHRAPNVKLTHLDPKR